MGTQGDNGARLVVLELWGANMKRLLIALTTFIGVTGTASAADMAVKARPIATPVPYSWTGCFVGVAG